MSGPIPKAESTEDGRHGDYNKTSTWHPPLNVAFFQPDDSALEFLRATISADEDELKQRIFDVQKEAYAIVPFPCIRLFTFVRLMMAQHPVYEEVLAAGKMGNTTFIDIGCCMGSDVRKLAYDGYPAAKLLGSDIVPQYLQLGHKLYNDSSTSQIRFLTADILALPLSLEPSAFEDVPSSQVTELSQLRGSLVHIHTNAVFHLFDEPTQYQMALRLAYLLKREKDSIIFGRHAGFADAKKIQDPPQWRLNRWGHSPGSWQKVWTQVFTELEGAEFAATRVQTSVELVLDTGEVDEATYGPRRTALLWSVRIL